MKITIIPQHYKVIRTVEKNYGFYDAKTLESFEIIQNGPSLQSKKAVLAAIFLAWINENEVVLDNEILMADDSVEVIGGKLVKHGSFECEENDFKTFNELLTRDQRWQLAIYNHISGNNFGNDVFITNYTKKECYSILMEHDDVDAKLIWNELFFTPNKELFKLHKEFAALKAYHSDWNQFTRMIALFGWNKGITMIKGVIECLGYIQRHNEQYGSEALDYLRTHGDDELFSDTFYCNYAFNPADYYVKLSTRFGDDMIHFAIYHNSKCIHTNNTIGYLFLNR